MCVCVCVHACVHVCVCVCAIIKLCECSYMYEYLIGVIASLMEMNIVHCETKASLDCYVSVTQISSFFSEYVEVTTNCDY